MKKEHKNTMKSKDLKDLWYQGTYSVDQFVGFIFLYDEEGAHLSLFITVS